MFDYKLIRSKRKTLAVQVTEDGEVIVRAPMKCSVSKIEKFVAEQEEWISKAVKKQQQIKSGKLVLSDETIFQLKKLARETLIKKTAYYAELMNVEYTGVKINSAQKRFGSCSGKNSINYSYLLMLYPEEAIDYVVVHELAHTVHHDHSRNFYRFVASIMPDYKKRDKLLKGPQKLPAGLSE